MIKFTRILSGLFLSSVMFSGAAFADDGKMYEVTITNLTRGISFTPIMAATHRGKYHMFHLGGMASPEVANMAEGGDTSGLPGVLHAFDSVSSDGLLGPGESVTLMVKAGKKNKYLSVASMMLPTNDGFIAVNKIRLPKGGHMRTVLSPAYDAGSEANDELCANIPGPHCGGAPFSEGDAEGFVHIHAGIFGIGDLVASQYGWHNPAAKITIKAKKK